MNLKELIATTKGDRSFEDLSRASGGTPQAARWWSMATEPLKVAPTPATIQAVARALGVTERQVWLAVGDSLGLEVGDRDSRLVQLLPPGTEELTDDATASVLALIRVLLQQTRAANQAAAAADSSPEPEPAAATPIRRGRKG